MVQGVTEFQEFYKRHHGFANTLFEILRQSADVFFRVTNSFEDVYKAMLSTFPSSEELGILVDDVIFVINELPFAWRRISQSEGKFEAKLHHPSKKNKDSLEQALKSIDEKVLRKIWDRSFSEKVLKDTQTQGSIDIIEKRIQEKNQALEKLLTAPSVGYRPSENTTFLIARLWNSWTPSFFEVPGGCYAIIPPKTIQEESTMKGKVIVVDPGFGFLKVLRKDFGIGIAEIDTIIVSHFHPDHVGGLFEYIALQNTYYKQTRQQATLYLNPTCKNVFGNLSPAIESRILENGKEVIILEKFKRKDGRLENISLKPFETNHWELGYENKSLGFIVSIETCEQESFRFHSPQYPSLKRIAIVGDTAYSPELSKKVCSADILVFHLGSFQSKDSRGKGKHLYEKGLIDLLRDCGTHIRATATESRKIILVSELGLEHAKSSYIRKYWASTTSGDLPPELDDDTDYIQLISEILQKEAKDWGDVYIPGLGTKVDIGEKISVELGKKW